VLTCGRLYITRETTSAADDAASEMIHRSPECHLGPSEDKIWNSSDIQHPREFSQLSASSMLGWQVVKARVECNTRRWNYSGKNLRTSITSLSQRNVVVGVRQVPERTRDILHFGSPDR
jgi:hypothetical protein